MVEGVCGPGSIGDIAIDDVLLVDKHCSKEKNGILTCELFLAWY